MFDKILKTKYDKEISDPILTKTIFVQRLRSKHWTYMSKFCFFFSVFHSVSNFLGFVLVKALPIGASCPTVQLYTRQEREWERE